MEIRNTCVLKCFCCYRSGTEKTLLIGDGKDNIPSSSHRNVLSQPLIISGHGTNARINVRKLNELAHHLAMADRITELREKVGRWHGMHVRKMPIPCLLLSKCISHISLCLYRIGCVCVFCSLRSPKIDSAYKHRLISQLHHHNKFFTFHIYYLFTPGQCSTLTSFRHMYQC